MKPDPAEVDAFAWFHKKVVTGIVAAAEEEAGAPVPPDTHETMR